MILIDELELALHPSAQIELLDYLTEIAAARGFTIIFSTHSASLIKHVQKSRVLLLQRDDVGKITCVRGAFPSLVLGSLALREDAVVDRVFYVEDECAREMVRELLDRVITETTVHGLRPSVYVIPVGGIAEVLRFFDKQGPLLPATAQAEVVLDADAREGLEAQPPADVYRIYGQHNRHIHFLPFTPEVQFMANIRAALPAFRERVRAHFQLAGLDIRVADCADEGRASTPDAGDRAAGKRVLATVVETLAEDVEQVEMMVMETPCRTHAVVTEITRLVRGVP